MTLSRERIDTADCAKLIRAALKKAFPATKFSVRSDRYAGGSSIRVGWTDGPTTGDVDKVAGAYSGASFDGMVDLKIYNQHWLEPDGTATVAHGGGGGSTLTEVIGDPPSPNSRLVSFGVDFVLTQRDFSPEFEAKIIAHIEATFALDTPGNKYARDARYGNGWASDLFWRVVSKTAGDGEIVDGGQRG